jgi:hypothetical protein
MDTSTKYVLMCRKAQQYIKAYSSIKRNIGDFYVNNLDEINVYYNPLHALSASAVLLPSVDQLSTWLKNTHTEWSLSDLYGSMQDFLNNVNNNTYSTLEQYWLAFFMSELKEWSDSDWELPETEELEPLKADF